MEVVRAGVTPTGRPRHHPTATERAEDTGTYRLPRRNVPNGAHTAMMKGGTRHPLTHLDIETGILEMIDLLIGMLKMFITFCVCLFTFLMKNITVSIVYRKDGENELKKSENTVVENKK